LRLKAEWVGFAKTHVRKSGPFDKLKAGCGARG
jgi:hypothetical protein